MNTTETITMKEKSKSGKEVERVYHVSFLHEWMDLGSIYRNLKQACEQNVTICIITPKGNLTQRVGGVTVRNPTDRNDKERAKAIAFVRAVKNLLKTQGYAPWQIEGELKRWRAARWEQCIAHIPTDTIAVQETQSVEVPVEQQS